MREQETAFLLCFADETNASLAISVTKEPFAEAVDQHTPVRAPLLVSPRPPCSLQQIAGNMSLTTMFWEEVADKGYDIMPNTVIDVRCSRWHAAVLLGWMCGLRMRYGSLGGGRPRCSGPINRVLPPSRRHPLLQIWLSDQELLSLIKAGHKVVESYGL